MYADRYAPRRVNRGSLGLSIGIVAPILAAALLTSPVVRHVINHDPITIIQVLPPPPPPPPDPIPKPQPRTPVARPLPLPDPIPIPRVPDPSPTNAVPDPGPTTAIGIDPGPVGIPTPEPTRAPPVFVGPAVDPRYADAMQPAYPAAETRAGHDGVVTLKVLVGIDGRVKQVERVAATSDEFWRVTERQALTRWRFKPATRDDIPTEAWRTMVVRFHLADPG